MRYAVEYLPMEGRGIEIVELDCNYDKVLENIEGEACVSIVLEIPNSISHWDKDELLIFYQWILWQKRCLPVDINDYIEQWLKGKREDELNAVISVNSFDANCLEDIELHDKCIELLKATPTKR